ncbi:MAG TPA: TraB/GumN family protein [Flavisolibacter sp.]
MKRSFLLTFLFASVSLLACGQKAKTKPKQPSASASTNTLLWRISGKNLSQPSYLFGTMHMLCGDDIVLSDSLKAAIKASDNVYLELEMDNMFEMIGAMQHMNMKGDTTLEDLLTKDEYKKVKTYFEENSTMLPFSMLQSFKPMLAASLIAEQQTKASCDNMVAMEQLIMKEARTAEKKIKGLETMNYQLGIFDKIPYQLQAKQLYQMIAKSGDTTGANDLQVLTNAYRSQQLEKLEEMMVKEDMGIKNVTELLLYNRNENWTKKMQELMPKQSVVVAVGAGHLPGKRGVINLLRKAGYKVDPVRNEMISKKSREI